MNDWVSKIIASIGEQWFRAFVFVIGCLWIWHTFFGSVAEVGTAQNAIAQGQYAAEREAAIAKIQVEQARYVAEKAKSEAAQAKAQACLSALDAAMKNLTLPELQQGRIPYLPECPTTAANQPRLVQAPHVAQAPQAPPVQQGSDCAAKYSALLDRFFPPNAVNVSSELTGAIDAYKATCAFTREMNEQLKARVSDVLARIDAVKKSPLGKQCPVLLDSIVAGIRNGGTIPAMKEALGVYVEQCPPMTDEEKADFTEKLKAATAAACDAGACPGQTARPTLRTIPPAVKK